MRKSRNRVIIIVSAVLLVLSILPVVILIQNKRRSKVAKTNAEIYLQNKYSTRMIFKSQSYYFPELLHFVKFFSEDNPDIVFSVYLTGNDIEVWKDDYYLKKAEYKIAQKYELLVSSAWNHRIEIRSSIYGFDKDAVIDESDDFEEVMKSVGNYSLFFDIEKNYQEDEKDELATNIIKTVELVREIGYEPSGLFFKIYDREEAGEAKYKESLVIDKEMFKTLSKENLMELIDERWFN